MKRKEKGYLEKEFKAARKRRKEIEKRKIVGLLATFCLGFDLVMTVLAVLAIL